MFSFGNNNAQTNTGFGNTNTSTSGFKLGSSTSTTPTNGLFGSTATSKPSTGFSFGSTTTSAPSTGLFGATASSAPSTGLFGATASSAPSTGLFSATASSAPTTSLFGAKTSAPSTGLFGSTVTTTPSTGLFSATASKPTTGFSFNSNTTAAQPSTGLFGANKATTTTAPGTTANQPITLQTLAPDTHYSALPDTMKVELDNLDKMIQDQIHIFESISQSTIPNAIQKVNEDTQELSQKLTSLTNILERDNYLINDLKKKVASELRNAELATRFIDRLNNQNQTKDIYSFHDGITEYFETLCTGFEEKMQIYKQSIDEIEQQLLSMSQNTQHNPQELVEILRNQHESIMYLSSKVASLNDDIDKRRQEYQSFRSKYSNDVPLGVSKSKSVGEKLSLSTIANSLRPASTINNNPMQPQVATTNKFGSTGFGSTGTTGFGSTSTTGFGSTNTGFGSTNTKFGTGTTGFGSTNTKFGTGVTGFGSNNTGFGSSAGTKFGSTTSGFGSTNTTTGFGSTNTGFGSTNTTTGFGSTNTGFGSTNTTTGFGSTNTGFGNTATTGFGNSTSLFNKK